MKIKLLTVALISAFSLNASAEMKLALGYLDSLKKCRQGNADQCDLHERIKKYNQVASVCIEKTKGWFGKDPSEVSQCGEADELLKAGDIELEE
jgi:hypothetical protein